MTFYDGSTALGTATLSGKKASLKTTAVAIGSQAITAVYSGDTNYSPSTSAVLTQTVNQDSTTTKVTSSANPAVYGQSVTFTATVKAASPGSGTANGNGDVLRRHDGSRQRYSQRRAPPRSRQRFLVVGSHSITAVYSGDPNFTTSTSSALTQTVNQAATTTVVVSVCESLGLWAAVDVHGDGEREFTPAAARRPARSRSPQGSTQLGTATLSDGTASLTASSLLSVGNDTIKASYSGDTNFKTSSGTLAQTVNQDSYDDVGRLLDESLGLWAVGDLHGDGGGERAGEWDSDRLGHVHERLNDAGHRHAEQWNGFVQHRQTGDGPGHDHRDVQRQRHFVTSNASLNQTVNQDATSATVTSSLNPSVYGQSVTFTAVVSAASPGSGTPTGPSHFMDGSTTLDTGTLNSSGKATFKTSALLAGSHSITVVYSGDTNFVTSTSRGPEPNGQHGWHDHQRELFGEPVGLRTVGDLHGHRQSRVAGERDADRHRHLHGWFDDAGNWHAESR